MQALQHSATGNKTLNYAYPTSPQAVKFGLGRVGAWYVEVGGSPVLWSADINEALDYWESIENPVGIWCMTNSPTFDQVLVAASQQ